MRVILEIDDPEEIEKFSQFFKEHASTKAARTAKNRKRLLAELKKEVRIHLPSGFRFDRNEIYDRPSLR